MKIAIVSPYDLGVNGGVQDQVVRLGRWLSDLGHDPLLIGPGESGPDGALLLGNTTVIRSNRSSTPIILDPRVAGSVRSAVEGFDVIHVHEPFMPFVSTVATAIRDIPSVGTFHADPPRLIRSGYRVASPLLKLAVRRLDVVTTVSHVSGSAIGAFTSARVIPNGVDTEEYSSGEKIVNRVVFLGRDDERKGLQVLLDAWPSVIERIPDAQLHVLGASREAEIAGVTFLGRVSESEKISELSEAEVYCAPNLGGESFGIVLVEGMASGCAVVASGIPAFVGVLSDAGTFVAPGDPVSLGDSISNLLSDRDQLRARQREGSVRAECFTGSHVAGLYVDAYRDAVERHRC